MTGSAPPSSSLGKGLRKVIQIFPVFGAQLYGYSIQISITVENDQRHNEFALCFLIWQEKYCDCKARLAVICSHLLS